MINAVGGVVVDVERPIRDDQYPNEDYSIRRIYIPAGLQWLDGERALWYARSRHESNDFDRGLRQQRLMLSLKERLREPATLRKLPVLMDVLAGAVQTDITPKEALALARLASTRDVGAVRSLVLQPPQYGSEIIRPNFYAINPNVPRIRQDVAATLAPGVPGAPVAIPTTVRPLPELPVGVLGQGGPGADDSAGDDADDASP
jgi:anionic cell wall polymer biosynthesis LytR-Cps2A-Psr (LCP) family protein